MIRYIPGEPQPPLLTVAKTFKTVLVENLSVVVDGDNVGVSNHVDTLPYLMPPSHIFSSSLLCYFSSDLDWAVFEPDLLVTSSVDTYIYIWDIK